VMAYGLWTGPNDQRVDSQRTNFARPQLIRALMVKNGDAEKPIWAMEIGWNAMPADLEAAPMFGRVSREMQADFAAQAYQRALQDWPWMGTLNYWFFKRATDTEKEQPFYYFSLLEPDFTAWPAYDALKQYAAGARAVYPGYHQGDHWALDYEGDWRQVSDAAAVLGGYRHGAQGARLRFDLWGSDLFLVTLGTADPATLRVTIDGRQVNPVPVEVQSRPAIALLRSASPARHTVEIEVSGEQGLSLDGLLVTRADRRGSYALGALGLLIAAAGASWLTTRRLRSRRG